MQLKAFKEKAREYAKDFVQDESGMELLQLAIAVVITCGLIGSVVLIQTVIKNGLKDSADTVTAGFNEALGGGVKQVICCYCIWSIFCPRCNFSQKERGDHIEI